jgi:lysophospholipase L1-like esterase
VNPRTTPLAIVLALVPAVIVGSISFRSAYFAAAQQRQAPAATRWVATWAASPQLVEPANLPPAPGFADTTVRQCLRTSIPGRRIRVRFSNEYSRTALTLQAASIARSAGGGAIAPGTTRPITFGGRPSVRIPEGASYVSDAFDFDLPAMADVAITVYVRGAPADVTGHPGSRTTSYFQRGEAVTALELPDAVRVDHWYFISGIDVVGAPAAAAVAVMGDSITDGRGSTTNGNDRWPDVLSRRLRASKATAEIAVLNLGLGGNRLLRDGVGPNVLARFDRDVVAQPGVRWLIVLAGVNDIGTAAGARAKGEAGATAEDVIAAYEQIVTRAHAHGISVFGATIMPLAGFGMYDTPETEADRQKINTWVRTSGGFDAVVDFDKVVRDPAAPARLSAGVDGGDHLHLSADGYRVMGEAVDLRLFQAPAARR